MSAIKERERKKLLAMEWRPFHVQAQRASEGCTISNCFEGHIASFKTTSANHTLAAAFKLFWTVRGWLYHSPSQNALGVQKICLRASKLCVCFKTPLLGKEENNTQRKTGKMGCRHDSGCCHFGPPAFYSTMILCTMHTVLHAQVLCTCSSHTTLPTYASLIH